MRKKVITMETLSSLEFESGEVYGIRKAMT